MRPDQSSMSASSETDGKEQNHRSSGRNMAEEETVHGSEGEDKISTVSTELSEVPTVELFNLSRPATPDFMPGEPPQVGSLTLPWGESQYDDCDVIAVHGLRDDRATVWKSKSGKAWIQERLFVYRCIRQLDYSYATDESARIYQPDGIKMEARQLLRLYSDRRNGLAPTETRRPIFWICHDIGGTIVKQALIEATQPKLQQDYESSEEWELAKEAHLEVLKFSKAIIFLGSPHRAQDIDTLEDELYTLMSLPGPQFTRGITKSINNLARQVQNTNIRALEGNFFSRYPSIQAYYTPENKGNENIEEEYASNSDVESSSDESLPKQNILGTLVELPMVPASPFSPYTLSSGHWMEVESHFKQSIINHADLVRGDEGVPEDKSWLTNVATRFVPRWRFPSLISDSDSWPTAMLAMAPPTSYSVAHFSPRLHEIPPFLSQEKLKMFYRRSGPQIMYIYGLGDPARTAMISQYWQRLDEGLLSGSISTFCGDTFYYQFEKFDNRRNTIRAMILTWINEIMWSSRFISYAAESACFKLLQAFSDYHPWSLSDLFRVFQDMRRTAGVSGMVIFLSCFDSCVEDERTWFLKEVLNEQDGNDTDYRLIISTSGADSLLLNSLPISGTLCLAELSQEVVGFAVDETGLHASGLDSSLAELLRLRPALQGCKEQLETLMQECHGSPFLGYQILNWLGHFGRGIPNATIAATLNKLQPVTPSSIISTVMSSIPLWKRNWAARVYQWVVFALEPLTTGSLVHAVAASTAPLDSVVLADVDQEQFLKDLETHFAGLIVFDGRELKLSHEFFYEASITGVKEFLNENPEAIHGALAKACLEYLMNSQVQPHYQQLAVDSYGDDSLKRPLFLPRDGLLEYAVQYWPEHYRLAGSERPFTVALKFFRELNAYRKWSEAYYLLSNPFTRIQRSYLSSLPMMAALGLEDLIQEQMEQPYDFEQLNLDYWLSITEAARHGHSNIVRTLLARVQPDNRGLQDAILWTSATKHHDNLALLINHAASMDGFQWPEGLLPRAAFAGHDTLISALLKRTISPGKDSKELAIDVAIKWNRPSSVRVLLESCSDLDQKPTYLDLAIRLCRPNIVRLLIDLGANLVDRGDHQMGVVNKAIMSSDNKSLEILISSGADFKSGGFGTDLTTICPIAYAADRGTSGCLHILLEHGMDHLEEVERNRILYAISSSSHQIGNCRLLMDNGAEPNQTFTDKAMLFINVLKTKNPEFIKLFLDHGAKPDSYDSWEGGPHRTPLTHAVHCNSFEVVKLLLDHDASPNYCPYGSESALQAAAWEGSGATRDAELLLHRGADLSWVRESDGWSPLQTAYDSPKLVRLFLHHGADVEKQCDCGTVLMMAARWGFIETVRTLITHRDPQPDLDAQYRYEQDDDYGKTAFHFALKKGHLDIANLLLDSGASFDVDGNKNFMLFLDHDLESRQVSEAVKCIQTCLELGVEPSRVDENGNTHLHMLGSSTSVPVIQALIDGGVPIDATNKAGWTPLAVAVECGNLDATKLLLLKHARPDIWIPDEGNLLLLACKAHEQPASTIINILKLLIEAKVDPHVPGSEPDSLSLLYTAMLHPSKEDRRKLVQYLVGDVKVDINGTGGSRCYPVIVAAEKKDTSLFEYLLRHGAQVGVTDSSGLSLLHYAMFMDPGEPRIYSLLKRSNADFQAPDKYGRTPLHFVAALGYRGDIEWLLRHLPNPDLEVKDGDGWTPLMWACKLDASNSSMVEWLIDRGADYWAKSSDGAWSAHKIACLCNMEQQTLELLQPPESGRERVVDGIAEVWDPLFHHTEPGVKHTDFYCGGCLMDITGSRQKCTTCDFDLCFKCFPHRLDMHDQNHEFDEFIDTDASSDVSRAQSSDSDVGGTSSSENSDEDDNNAEESAESKEGGDGHSD